MIGEMHLHISLVGKRTVTLGEFLRQQRGRKGLLQREVAGKANIDQSRLSRLERDLGDKFPTPEELAGLAEALDCQPRELMAAAGYPVDDDRPESDADDDQRIYTMLERNTSLTSYQKQIIRLTWEEAQRRRREIEGG